MNARGVSLAAAILAMVGTAFLAMTLRPQTLMARTQATFDLQKALPSAFGQWSAAPGVRLVEPPGSDTLSRQIYEQEVARGYVDREGHLVMLLVAYGESQSERLQLHRPEVCYTAQGFSVSKVQDALFKYDEASPPIAIRRLVTRQDARLEPVTYWMRIGYDVSEGLLARQRLKLEYGLRGLIPDGVLFRVSTIGLSPEKSFAVEDQFIRDFIAAVDPTLRAFVVGAPSRAFLAPARS